MGIECHVVVSERLREVVQPVSLESSFQYRAPVAPPPRGPAVARPAPPRGRQATLVLTTTTATTSSSCPTTTSSPHLRPTGTVGPRCARTHAASCPGAPRVGTLSRMSRGPPWRWSPRNFGRQTWRRGQTWAARRGKPKARYPKRALFGFEDPVWFSGPCLVFRALLCFQDPVSFSGGVFVFRGRRPKRGRGPTLPANRAKTIDFYPGTLIQSHCSGVFRFQDPVWFSGPCLVFRTLFGFQDPSLVFRAPFGFQGGALGFRASGLAKGTGS